MSLINGTTWDNLFPIWSWQVQDSSSSAGGLPGVLDGEYVCDTGHGSELNGLKAEATPVGRCSLPVQEHCLGA